MKNKITLLLAVLLSLPIIVMPTAASAASVYDTTYKSTDTLVQKGYYGCSDQDVTFNWSQYLTNDEFSELRTSFDLAKSQGRWGVSVSYGQVNVFWTEDTSLYLDWTDPAYGGGYSIMAKGNAVHRAEFSLSGYYSPKPCIPYVSSYSTDASAFAIVTDKFGYNKNLFIVTDYPNYPDDYEGSLLVSSEPKAKYVAMGDSFSSGEGNPSFEASTNQDGVNECHRSPMAYPRLLQNDLDLVLGSTTFEACSGATTADVLYGGSGKGGWSEGPQVDALSANTQVVTITIGGNDVGFEEYARQCVMALCGPENAGFWVYDAIMDNIESEAFSQNLKSTYESILTHAPNAQVYVIDYPYLFDPSGMDSTSCVVMDTSGAIPVQFGLNSTIKSVVNAVKAESGDYDNRLKLVESNAPTSPFNGKHLCTDDPAGTDYNGIYGWPNEEYSFHPNSSGQEDYKSLVKNTLS